jgi:Zn-finger nucleic acid-binding protein
VTVHVCRDGCAGIWFDRGGLKEFDDPKEIGDEGLFAASPVDGVHVDLAQRRHCPRCVDTVLMRHFSSAKRTVTVDECSTCAGIWLDGGELKQIRSEYPSEDARQKAARVQFEEVLVDSRMEVYDERIAVQVPYDTARSRIVSSVIFAGYVLVAYRYGGALGAIRVVSFSLLPLTCIWFSDALGSIVQGRFTRESPRSFVWFFGWLVFLLPLIQIAIIWAGMH